MADDQPRVTGVSHPRGVPTTAVSQKPEADAVAPGAGPPVGPPPSAAADGIAGPGSGLHPTEAEPAGPGTPALPLLAERRWIRVLGSGDGLVQPVRAAATLTPEFSKKYQKRFQKTGEKTFHFLVPPL